MWVGSLKRDLVPPGLGTAARFKAAVDLVYAPVSCQACGAGLGHEWIEGTKPERSSPLAAEPPPQPLHPPNHPCLAGGEDLGFKVTKLMKRMGQSTGGLGLGLGLGFGLLVVWQLLGCLIRVCGVPIFYGGPRRLLSHRCLTPLLRATTVEVERAVAGDIVSIAGVAAAGIADTVAALEVAEALHPGRRLSWQHGRLAAAWGCMFGCCAHWQQQQQAGTPGAGTPHGCLPACLSGPPAAAVAAHAATVPSESMDACQQSPMPPTPPTPTQDTSTRPPSPWCLAPTPRRWRGGRAAS